MFLRGCGLCKEEIAYFHSRTGKRRYYTCFISYSVTDEVFASRLYYDFQDVGISCWMWKHDARTGKPLWDEIDKAIKSNEKLVLIASKSSLESPAVNREIERALVLEDDRFRQKQAGDFVGDVDVLFPVQLDDYIFEKWHHARKIDVTQKMIADARGWQSDPEVYPKVREKLIKDLKAE